MSAHDPHRPSTGRDSMNQDHGAALVVAVAFVVMIGTIVAGLTAMVTSGLDTRVALEDIRDRQYAADGAVEQAIASLRSQIELGALNCDGTGSSDSELNGIAIHVDRLVICDAVLDASGMPVTQLGAVLTACEDTGTACGDDQVIVRALVGFELEPDGSVAHVPVHSWSVER